MSSALRAYKRAYQKKGQKDLHEQIFGAVPEIVGNLPKRVLYPGCHRHITASLVFPDVDYLDFDKKVADVYKDEKVKDWVLSERQHEVAAPKWTFTCASYDDMAKNAKYKKESYDLMISLSAGIVSEPCKRYIRPDGYFLVNDSHADASAAFVATNDEGTKSFRLIAAWEDGKWETSNLQDYFKTTKGDYISIEQAREAAKIGSKSKRSFRMLKDASFYIFQKSEAVNEGDKVVSVSADDEPKQPPKRKRRRLK